MLTVDGKTHIKRYLASFVPAIGRSIAFGIGSAAENINDTQLQFETGRADVLLTTYDFNQNKLIFKAAVPNEYSGKIYEVGLYTQPSNIAAGNYGGQLITTFDSESEEWFDLDGVSSSLFASTNSRIGLDSMRQGPTAGTTKTDLLRDLELDLSGYSAADLFTVAASINTANVSAMSVVFLTDASNYYTFAFGAQSAGYKFLQANKGSATVTGTPSWANITEVRVTTTATGGAAQVDWDGIRIDDIDTNSPDYVLVSREVITPYTKAAGRTNEIEFAIGVNL